MSIVTAETADAEQLATIISCSNKDVAQQFGINSTNNSKHPSFYNKAWVLTDFAKGALYFLYQHQGSNVGCVCYETPDGELAYLNRLAVLPEYQHHGIGEKLVKYFFDYARTQNIQTVSIATISNHSRLNNWYLKLGFVEEATKHYPHLPFDVTFMTYDLGDRP